MIRVLIKRAFYFTDITLGADHLTLEEGGGAVGDFEKKFPASACRKKKIACSTNVMESLWEKHILPTILLEKILDVQKSPTPTLKS